MMPRAIHAYTVLGERSPSNRADRASTRSNSACPASFVPGSVIVVVAGHADRSPVAVGNNPRLIGLVKNPHSASPGGMQHPAAFELAQPLGRKASLTRELADGHKPRHRRPLSTLVEWKVCTLNRVQGRT